MLASLMPVSVAVIIVEYAIPNSGPNGIVTGPDGNLWITDAGNNAIDRFMLSGAVTAYPLPTANVIPNEITVGPDGKLWFLEFNGAPTVKIGKITTGGTVTEYTTNSGFTSGITAGPDGNIWFNARDLFSVAKMTPTGTETDYPVPGNPASADRSEEHTSELQSHSDLVCR